MKKMKRMKKKIKINSADYFEYKVKERYNYN